MRVAAILTFDKSLYLRGRLQLTTARRLSAYMSSRALATNTTPSYVCSVCLCMRICVCVLLFIVPWRVRKPKS